MKKVEPELIEKYINEIKTELPENEKNMAYPEISVVKEAATKLNETNLEETKKEIEHIENLEEYNNKLKKEKNELEEKMNILA